VEDTIHSEEKEAGSTLFRGASSSRSLDRDSDAIQRDGSTALDRMVAGMQRVRDVLHVGRSEALLDATLEVETSDLLVLDSLKRGVKLLHDAFLLVKRAVIYART